MRPALPDSRERNEVFEKAAEMTNMLAIVSVVLLQMLPAASEAEMQPQEISASIEARATAPIGKRFRT